MAYQNDQSRFTELFTSLDRGRHWHNVTPPVVVAGENDWNHYPHTAVMDPLTPFVLDSRDAWWPVLRSYGQGDQSSELYVYMTSDAGRRWALRGRFPHAELGGLFFLSPSTGFIETETAGGGGARPEDLAPDLRHLRWGPALARSLGNRPPLRSNQRRVLCQPPPRVRQWVLRLGAGVPRTYERRGP